MSYINLAVTLSNLAGIMPIMKARYQPYKLVGVTITVLSSIMMHISETKHGLPGLCLSRYSNQLLWLDRITAYTSVGYAMVNIYINPELVTNMLLTKAIIGVSCNIMSEMMGNKQIPFMILHSIWHILAYSCLSDIL